LHEFFEAVRYHLYATNPERYTDFMAPEVFPNEAAWIEQYSQLTADYVSKARESLYGEFAGGYMSKSRIAETWKCVDAASNWAFNPETLLRSDDVCSAMDDVRQMVQGTGPKFSYWTELNKELYED
jgi:hypothetical protein